jgi:site-specific recombinase
VQEAEVVGKVAHIATCILADTHVMPPLCQVGCNSSGGSTRESCKA